MRAEIGEIASEPGESLPNPGCETGCLHMGENSGCGFRIFKSRIEFSEAPLHILGKPLPDSEVSRPGLLPESGQRCLQLQQDEVFFPGGKGAGAIAHGDRVAVVEKREETAEFDGDKIWRLALEDAQIAAQSRFNIFEPDGRIMA